MTTTQTISLDEIEQGDLIRVTIDDLIYEGVAFRKSTFTGQWETARGRTLTLGDAKTVELVKRAVKPTYEEGDILQFTIITDDQFIRVGSVIGVYSVNDGIIYKIKVLHGADYNMKNTNGFIEIPEYKIIRKVGVVAV